MTLLLGACRWVRPVTFLLKSRPMVWVPVMVRSAGRSVKVATGGSVSLKVVITAVEPLLGRPVESPMTEPPKRLMLFAESASA